FPATPTRRGGREPYDVTILRAQPVKADTEISEEAKQRGDERYSEQASPWSSSASPRPRPWRDRRRRATSRRSQSPRRRRRTTTAGTSRASQPRATQARSTAPP